MKKKLRSMYHQTEQFIPKFPIKEFRMGAISQCKGETFEIRMAEMFFVLGWSNIITTPRTGDYGADLLATDTRGRKWVIQCKRYSKPVSASAVREVFGASRSAYKRGEGIMVITNSTFTKEAIITAEEFSQYVTVWLIDHERLAELMAVANDRLASVNNYFCRR